VDVRRSPQLVLEALRRINARGSAEMVAVLRNSLIPTPVATKALVMRAQQRLGPDNRDGVQNRRKPAIDLDEEQAITVGQLNPAGPRPRSSTTDKCFVVRAAPRHAASLALRPAGVALPPTVRDAAAH